MSSKFTRGKVVQLCVLLLIILVAGIFYQSLDGLSLPDVYEESEPLGSITPADLFELRKKYPDSSQPPKDVEKACEIVRQCEELWNELQQIKNEPGFARSHLAVGTRHHDWLLRVQAVHDSLPPVDEIGDDVYVLPGWLIAAARDLAGRPQDGWKASTEGRFAEYQLPVAKKAVESENDFCEE